MCEDAEIMAVFSFFRGVLIFDLIFHKKWMFLCSLERKIPEFFKIYPIYISSPLLKAPKSTQQFLNDNFTYFVGHPRAVQEEEYSVPQLDLSEYDGLAAVNTLGCRQMYRQVKLYRH